MNDQGILGALLPLWIIGAPLIAGVIMLFSTPKPNPRDRRDEGLMRDRPGAYVDPIRPVPVASPAKF